MQDVQFVGIIEHVAQFKLTEQGTATLLWLTKPGGA